MGLKFSDALRLSWSNVAQYKKRSVTIVLTLALLFGALLAVLSAASGVENTIIHTSSDGTHGAAYVQVRYDESKAGGSHHFGGGMGAAIDNIEDLSYEKFSPCIRESDLAKIKERATEYGGEVVGYTWNWQLGFPYNVVTLSAAEDFLSKSISSTPDGKMPTLMPDDWKVHGDFAMSEAISSTVYQVGKIPRTQDGHPTLPGFNPLNFILGEVTGNYMPFSFSFYIIDDGSGKIEEFALEQARICLQQEEGCSISEQHPEKYVVVKFSDPKQAVAFATPKQQLAGVPVRTNFPFLVSDLFGSTMATTESIIQVRVMLLPVLLVLFVVALIIATFTFAHLIDQDAATVALYRSMGASTGDIHLIYFLYLLELCVLTVFASIIIALLLVGILWIFNHQALAERLQEYYYLDSLPKVTLLGFDNLFWTVMLAILCLAPVALLLAARHFSARNIAKKLKED